MAYEVLKEFEPAGHAFNGATFWDIRVTVVNSSGRIVRKMHDRSAGTLEDAHGVAEWMIARAGF